MNKAQPSSSPPSQKKDNDLLFVKKRTSNLHMLDLFMQRRKACHHLEQETILAFVETLTDESLTTYDPKEWQRLSTLISVYFGRSTTNADVEDAWKGANKFLLHSIFRKRVDSLATKKIVFVHEMANSLDCFDESSRSRCTHCNYFKPNMWMCSGCFRGPYCSEACQHSDWKNHRIDCAKFSDKKMSVL